MNSAEPFVVTEDENAGWSRLELRGRITVACAVEFRDAALGLAASGRSVRVCCGAVEYMDAAALQVFLCLGGELTGNGLQCDVVDVPDTLAKVFRLAGVRAAS
jgi:anti-anti-sigma factor